MALVPFTSLIDRVMIELPGSPPAMLVREEVIGAMRQFCIRSWAWNTDIQPQDVTEGAATYPVTMQPGQALVQILRLAVEGTPLTPVGIDTAEDVYGHPVEQGTAGDPKRYTQRDPLEVILLPRPSRGQRGALSMRVAIMPTLEATTVSDVLTERWRDAIIHGALARMHAQNGKPWTNGEMSSFHAAQFNQAAELARDEVQRGLTRAGNRTKPRFM